MLDLSDRRELDILASVIQEIRSIPETQDLLLVGAAARGLLLTTQYGIAVSRATKDMDFAVATVDWPTFLRIRGGLLALDAFQPLGMALHAFSFRQSWRVDLIPFGGVQRMDGSIAWHPDHDHVMAMLGYREAWATAIPVLLPGQIPIRVVSLPAMAILKLFAWRDRRHATHGKDGEDLWVLLRNYLDAGQIERIYGEGIHLLDEPDFDLDRAGAWLLGIDSRKVLDLGEHPSMLLDALRGILALETDTEGALALVSDFRAATLDQGLDLLTAYRKGLENEYHP